ncbi:hypothetical protein CVD28_19010 [Bacillus sp. M6-12]|uniref:ABC transporter substrate-binding protein n=1 Tax=Bacillus sp. M6-12 TaxID=2054166 RepID=UPI000C793108|nr:sugar ABC transporter substrate-binding protein [Bacillus sp. M6-12]PLS16131.1 hypothetical protein CVD28_19010 [Bacillus sp. M6-12]
MKKVFSRFLILILTIVFCFSVIACSNSSSGEEKKGDSKYKGVTLNIASIKWDFMETYLGKYAKEVADEMGINLNTGFYTYADHRNKIVSDTMAGVKTWDLIYIDTKQIPEFATVGALESIESLNKKFGSEGYNPDDFTKNPLEESKFEGKQYGIPIMADTNGLVYRSDLFDDPTEKVAFKAKYGYELAVPKTYTQFRDIAEFFTRKKGEKLAGKVLKTDFYGTSHSNKVADFLWHDYLNYMVAFGGDIYDPNTMKPLWNSPENIAAGKYYLGLNDFMPSGHINMTSGESMAEFDKGRVAMIIEFYSRTLYLGDPKSSAIEGKFDFALLPTEQADRPNATVLSTNFMGVYSKSKNQEVAYEFLKRITDKAVTEKWALHSPDNLFKAGNPLFPTKSVMQNPEVLSRFPGLKTVEQTLSGQGVYAFQHIRLPEYSKIIDIGATSLSEAFAGKPVEESFDEAQEKLEELFNQSGYTK